MDLSLFSVIGVASILTALGGINAIFTELAKLAPVDWTSNNPKKLAGVCAVIVVSVFGYLYKEPLEVMAVILPGVLWLSNGIYDFVTGLIEWVRK